MGINTEPAGALRRWLLRQPTTLPAAVRALGRAVPAQVMVAATQGQGAAAAVQLIQQAGQREWQMVQALAAQEQLAAAEYV